MLEKFEFIQLDTTFSSMLNRRVLGSAVVFAFEMVCLAALSGLWGVITGLLI